MKIESSTSDSPQAPSTTHTFSLILEAIELKRFKNAIFLLSSLSSAELSQLDFQGWNLLHRAVESGDAGLVEAILSHMDRDAIGIRNEQVHSALEMAIERNMADICRLIVPLMCRDQLARLDANGWSALHLACDSSKKESLEIVSLLAEAMTPADLSTLSKHDERSALQWCMTTGGEIGTANARTLIAHMRPEDLIRPHSDSATYLEIAVRDGYIGIAEALREHMLPHDFNEIAETLQPEAINDNWRLMLTQKTACKGVEA
ncbi:MAG: ankyrin repeat domain-containing protein [Chlamydiia bacterium]|nr:ankyrin repeat domain-containing protein [Chlamydiia bacterium]